MKNMIKTKHLTAAQLLTSSIAAINMGKIVSSWEDSRAKAGSSLPCNVCMPVKPTYEHQCFANNEWQSWTNCSHPTLSPYLEATESGSKYILTDDKSYKCSRNEAAPSEYDCGYVQKCKLVLPDCPETT